MQFGKVGGHHENSTLGLAFWISNGCCDVRRFEPCMAVPGGSYLKTCQNISQTQSTVQARCENGRGFLRATSINLDRCQPGVGLDNIYGVLTCHSRLPSGSYRQSCSDAVVMDGFLRASCRTRSGQVNGSQIRLDACSRGDIANINGQLLCVDS